MSTCIFTYIERKSDLDRAKQIRSTVQALTTIPIVILCTIDIDKEHYFKVSNIFDVFKLEYYKLVYIPINTNIPINLNSIIQNDTPSKYGNILVFPRSLFPSMKEVPGNTIEEKYIHAGYTWINITTRKPSFLYKVRNHNALERLSRVLSPVLPEFDVILQNNQTLYELCFTHQSYDSTSNYEMLEAYGDRLLRGSFATYILTLPGINTPGDVDIIEKHYQEAYILSEIYNKHFDKSLILTKDTLTMKIESDVIEALYGAVYKSYEEYFEAGHKAIDALTRFLFKVYEIDTKNIKSYQHPKELYNNILQSKGDIYKAKEGNIYEKDGYVYLPVLYDNKLVAQGKVLINRRDKTGKMKDNLEKARKEVVIDAYNKALKSIDKYL